MLHSSKSTRGTSPLHELWTQTYKDVLLTLNIGLAPEWEEVFEAWGPGDGYARELLAMGGEGSGKSFQAGLFATAHSVFDAMYGAELYWVVGADFEDARKDFDYIFTFQEQLGNVKSKSMPASRDQQCVLETESGQTWVTISAYDATKLGREEPSGIVIAEVSRLYEEAFQRCESRILRRFPNAWLFASGSFESSLGWLPDLFKWAQGPTGDRGVRSFSIPSWANLQRFPGGREDAAIKIAEASMSPSKFMERFGGHPAPAKNVVFDEFRRNLHVDPLLKYDSSLPVYLAIDPGDKVYAVLAVQFTEDGEVHVVEEIYESHWTHRQVVDRTKLLDGWPLVRGGSIDIGAKQRHMGMPVPLEEWYRDTGLALWTQKVPVEDSIERVRVALATNPKTGRPRLRVHPSCRGLISEMGGGLSPVRDGGPWVYAETSFGMGAPRAENDHACKALAYLLAGPYGFASDPDFYAHSISHEPVSYLDRGRSLR